jgi:hypothetical protein
MAKETKKILKAEDVPSVSSLTNEERLELVEALQKEIDERTAEINKKYYVVDGGADTGKALLKFVVEEAQWKFTEAYGIMECSKELEAAIKKAEVDKVLFLQILPIEALWFFLNKVEGKGYKEARYYHDQLLKPIGSALHNIKADRDAVNELMLRQGSLEAGADFEQTPTNENATENATA